MSHETARLILVENLGMRRIAAWLVPIQLNFPQKQSWTEISIDMLDRANSDPNFMGSIITGHETWFYECDMQTSQKSKNHSTGLKRRAETGKTGTVNA